MSEKRKLPLYPNLEAEISRQGFMDYQVAERIGITPTNFSYKKSGKTSFDISDMKKLKELFNQSMDYLFETSGDTSEC